MLASIVRRCAPLLAVLALAACSESPSASDRLVRVTTDRDEYVTGSSGLATITNVSSRPVHYNFCVQELQRRTATGWVTVTPTLTDPGFTCVDVLLMLQPGSSTSAGFLVPAGVAAGIYRLLLPGIYTDGEDQLSAVVSPVFRVEHGMVLH